MSKLIEEIKDEFRGIVQRGAWWAKIPGWNIVEAEISGRFGLVMQGLERLEAGMRSAGEKIERIETRLCDHGKRIWAIEAGEREAKKRAERKKCTVAKMPKVGARVRVTHKSGQCCDGRIVEISGKCALVVRREGAVGTLCWALADEITEIPENKREGQNDNIHKR